MVRNNEGKIVDENGVEVFTSDLFKQLSSKDNLVEVCPTKKFVDFQVEKAYVTNPSDARKFVEFRVSKLIDDNFSLASDEAKRTDYINNVVCFLGMLDAVNNTAIKNDVVGGVFPTKNDNSTDSMVPMYLCAELLKAKCLNYLDTPITSLDKYDVTPQSTVEKNSTLGQEFDKVISEMKQLDYDKEVFKSDMSNASMDYLSRCQIDPSGMVDVYVKVEDDKSLLFVTQGSNSNSIKMFDIEKKQEVTGTPQVATPEIALPSIPAIETPVTAAPVTQPETPAVTEEPVKEEKNDTKGEVENVLELLEAASKIVEYANKISGNKLTDVKEALEKGAIHYRNESKFKETPAETELNSMIANQPQENPTVSINAAMFK